MLNSHCDNNGQKTTTKKKLCGQEIEPRIYGFEDHHGIHYAMEANGINLRQLLCVLTHSYE